MTQLTSRDKISLLMKNLKQYLLDQAAAEIAAKENDIKVSDRELAVLGARLKVEKKTFGELDQ